RMVAAAPRFHEIAPQIGAFLAQGTFVAHNAPFDWGFVTAELGRAGVPLADEPRLCTVRLARRLLRELPRRSLDAVCRHYDITIEARHRALGDAAATAQVLLRFIDELGRLGIDTRGDLDHWLLRRTTRRKRSALPRPTDDTFAA
ncbi:MAG: 3'-5' exonuclease, partial [Gemmatimonadetes bacterium]|nr:3'-5' exonuclease [Gemmatimonadota bacterium]